MTQNEINIDNFIRHLRLKRYSQRTIDIYREILNRFFAFSEVLDYESARKYEVYLMDTCSMNTKTVNLHLSVLSSFCNYLVKMDVIQSSPLKLLKRPKLSKRLPEFYTKDSMEEYLKLTEYNASEEAFKTYIECLNDSQNDISGLAKKLYNQRLARLMILFMYSLGIRRGELISLNIESLDLQRSVVKVVGKGDKMREIPLLGQLFQEILLYLKAVEALVSGHRLASDPLFLTFTGRRVYPKVVDSLVKFELSKVSSIKSRKSPHVLRHTVATELLNQGSELNSIKEFLGHSSLAATQVYTHNSIAKLKKIYESAHPRAKKGGNYGN